MNEDRLNWDQVPQDWNWAAQDADGKWYWYYTVPTIGIGGGIWRSNSRHQLFSHQSAPNTLWHESLRQRPANAVHSPKAK